MPEDVNQCLLCGSERSRFFGSRRFPYFVQGSSGKTETMAVAYRICQKCGLVFQSPRMTVDELAEFYERQYRVAYQGDEGPSRKDLFVQEGRAHSLLGFLREYGVSPSRHLDIGSSAGVLLEATGKAYGAHGVGIELGKAYREYATGRGLTIYADLDQLAKADEGKFDLISMAHVLEHISQPVEYLQTLREQFLEEDGYLLIEVPNLYCHDSFEIAHMILFSPHTLRQVLQQAGYRVLALKAHGAPRSDVLPLYLTCLARPMHEKVILVPERGVGIKRKMGLLRRRLVEKAQRGRAWKPLPKDEEGR